MPEKSIYEGPRLAQPDEVANYKTGSGLEKAFLLANIIRQKTPNQQIQIIADKTQITLTADQQYNFTPQKTLEKKINISPKGKIKT